MEKGPLTKIGKALLYFGIVLVAFLLFLKGDREVSAGSPGTILILVGIVVAILGGSLMAANADDN